MDHSLKYEIGMNADKHKDWHDFTTNVLLNGYLAKIPDGLFKAYENILNFPSINEISIDKYLTKLVNYMYNEYHDATCYKLMVPCARIYENSISIDSTKIYNVNRYMWESNYLQYVPINNNNHIRVTRLYDYYNNKQVISINDKRIFNLLQSINLEKNLDIINFYQKLMSIKLDISNYVLE